MFDASFTFDDAAITETAAVDQMIPFETRYLKCEPRVYDQKLLTCAYLQRSSRHSLRAL